MKLRNSTQNVTVRRRCFCILARKPSTMLLPKSLLIIITILIAISIPLIKLISAGSISTLPIVINPTTIANNRQPISRVVQLPTTTTTTNTNTQAQPAANRFASPAPYHHKNHHSNPYHNHNQQQQQQQSHQATHRFQQAHHHNSNNVNNNAFFRPNHNNQYQNSLPKLNICQVPESQLNQTKCSPDFEAQFKRGALAEFQAQLSESSLELRNLISTYWLDFRHHSLDLIRFGQRQTRTRILNEQLKTPASSKMPDWMYSQWVESSWRLYDTMISHLNSSLQTTNNQDSSNNQQQQFMINNNNNGQLTSEQLDLAQMSLNELNTDLNSFIRRLHLMQAKSLLDQRLEPIGFNMQNQMDLECMSANLVSQVQVDSLMNELIGYSSLNLDSQLEWSRRQAVLVAEQTQLTQSIRQSLEFARTLLSSLTLAREMFNNLTQRTIDWMPHSSCHNALTRMTFCPQCSPQYPNSATAPAYATTTATSPLPQTTTIQVVPCENYCLNVLRGCMNDIYELNRFWNDHVSLLNRFKSNMIQMNNIENVMSNLDENLVTFIMRLAQQTSISSISQLHSSSINSHSKNMNITNTISKNQQQQTDASIPLGNISRQVS